MNLAPNEFVVKVTIGDDETNFKVQSRDNMGVAEFNILQDIIETGIANLGDDYRKMIGEYVKNRKATEELKTLLEEVK